MKRPGAPGRAAAIHHHDDEAQFRRRLQPERAAKALGHKKRLWPGVSKFNDGILFGGIEIRWTPDESVQVGCTVRRLPLERFRKLPAGLRELADVGSLQFAHFRAILRPAQNGLPR